MARCDYCQREMSDPGTRGCDDDVLYEDRQGKSWPRVRVAESSIDPDEGRCGDCGAEIGNYHHPGCDQERCPKCGGQYISCKCFPADDEERDYYALLCELLDAKREFFGQLAAKDKEIAALQEELRIAKDTIRMYQESPEFDGVIERTLRKIEAEGQ